MSKAVEHALKHGYKHIDAAYAYENHPEVGAGIKASGVPREDIFITSKLQQPYAMGRMHISPQTSSRFPLLAV